MTMEIIVVLLQAAQPASSPSTPHRRAEHSSMVEASREGFLRPASCSGKDTATRHRGLQSGVSFAWRPGDAHFRNDP